MRNKLRNIKSLALSLIFLSSCALTGITQQIESVEITCVEVLPDGSVGITWEPIPDVNGIFSQYQVARHNTADQTNTNFDIIADINTTYTIDNGAIDANVTPESYQIIAVPTTGIASLSNVLCSMFLSGSEASGVVSLNWTDPVPVYSTVPAGSTYKIMAEFPLGTWSEVATLPYVEGLNSYDYEVSICQSFVNFRVDLCFPGATCSSSSNLIGLNVLDVTPPQVPQITSISVDTLSGNAVVDWNSVIDEDCGGYLVYLCDNETSIIIETITDCNQTEFEYPASDAGLVSEHYLVAAFDTCTAINPGGNLSVTEDLCPFIHSSMFLTLDWTTCQGFVDLSWEVYEGWGDDGVSVQEVYRKTNGADSELLATLDGDVEFYRDNSIEDNQEYCYFIKAYSATVNNATSLSNATCVNIIAPPTPNDFSLLTSTVTAPDEISIIVNTEATTTFFDYVLLRKSETDPFFQTIDNRVSNQNFAGFVDNNVSTSSLFYDYKIGLVNQCNDTVEVSNIGRTMNLDGLANSETLVNTITWNAYEDWENGVDSYEIYRSIDGGAPELIGVNGSNILYFEDDVSDQLQSKGQFCYYIVAKEGANSIGIISESVSNVLCLAQPPKIWIPNAFAVNGINDTFFPTISFADRDTYRMIIYNRWGQDIFTTTSINDGWDGTKQGNLIPEGTYMYYLEITDGSGQLHEHRGPITMLIFDAN